MGYTKRGPMPAALPASTSLKDFWEAVTEVEPPSLRIRIAGAVLSKAWKTFQPDHTDPGFNTYLKVLASLAPHIEEYEKNNRKD